MWRKYYLFGPQRKMKISRVNSMSESRRLWLSMAFVHVSELCVMDKAVECG